MKQQTALQQLKEKIQIVIGEMNGELNEYNAGYKQCLINIQNDIDDQMISIEKEQIQNAFDNGYDDAWEDLRLGGHPKYDSAEQYYNETYK